MILATAEAVVAAVAVASKAEQVLATTSLTKSRLRTVIEP